MNATTAAIIAQYGWDRCGEKPTDKSPNRPAISGATKKRTALAMTVGRGGRGARFSGPPGTSPSPSRCHPNPRATQNKLDASAASSASTGFGPCGSEPIAAVQKTKKTEPAGRRPHKLATVAVAQEMTEVTSVTTSGEACHHDIDAPKVTQVASIAPTMIWLVTRIRRPSCRP